MDSPKNATQDFAGRKLPWLVAAGALVLYLVTLNHWVSLTSLPMVARVAGWDWWLPSLQSPAFLLVTHPIRWLPGGIQAVALNIFTALCAALTLGLLARSIALLPHDRTPEQRLRETGLHARLSIGLNWVPPLAGALVLGLSLSFWEHATAASGEMFNLLVLSYVIRCLLEFRISGKQSWMDRFALVYGIAVVNDWGMIGFFPLFLAAVVWIKGWSFFSKSFLLRTTGLGLLGLVLYLYLPALGAAGTHVDQSFGGLLKLQLSLQKQSLLSVPRWVPLILSVASVLPVLCMGVRWTNSSGDTSSIGTVISQYLFPLVHGIFLGIGLWFMLDHIYSPRLIDPRSGFLSFYLLAALSIGYYAGYFLLICGKNELRDVQLPAWRRAVNLAIQGVVLLAVAAVPVALIARNLPQIRWSNGDTLSRYSDAVLGQIPKTGATLLADNPLYLLLAEGAARRQSPAVPVVSIDTRMLTMPGYHRKLKSRHGTTYGSVLADRNDKQSITDLELVGYMTQLAGRGPVYYLHHSFGYYFEAMYLAPRGLINELRPYEGWNVAPPRLDAAAIDANEARWQPLEALISDIDRGIVMKNREAMTLGSLFSRAINHWGVELQMAGRTDGARKRFEAARRLSGDNVAARINLLVKDTTAKAAVASDERRAVQSEVARLRSWSNILTFGGPVYDAGYCFSLGREYQSGNLKRQAILEYDKAVELDPRVPIFLLASADAYLQGRLPDRTLDRIGELRKMPDVFPMNATNGPILARMEALAYMAKTNFTRAENLLLTAGRQWSESPLILATLTQTYMATGKLPEALSTIDRQIKAQPNDAEAEMTRVAILGQMKQFEKGIESLNRILQSRPADVRALTFRAGMLMDIGDLDKAIQDLEAIRRANPKLAIAYRGLGEIAVRRGKNTDAIRYYLDAVKHSPPDSLELKQTEARLKQLKGDSATR